VALEPSIDYNFAITLPELFAAMRSNWQINEPAAALELDTFG
jgi:hypothetical protein